MLCCGQDVLHRSCRLLTSGLFINILCNVSEPGAVCLPSSHLLVLDFASFCLFLVIVISQDGTTTVSSSTGSTAVASSTTTSNTTSQAAAPSDPQTTQTQTSSSQTSTTQTRTQPDGQPPHGPSFVMPGSRPGFLPTFGLPNPQQSLDPYLPCHSRFFSQRQQSPSGGAGAQPSANSDAQVMVI